METLAILILVFFTIKHGGAEPNNVYQEVRVGLVVEFGSAEGKILKNSFSLALSDFYRINNGYRTRVSVLARDSRGDPLLSLAAGSFHFLFVLLVSIILLKGSNARMLLMRQNSLCHTLTYSHIVLSILILFVWMGNVESVPLYMTNQNRAKSGS